MKPSVAFAILALFSAASLAQELEPVPEPPPLPSGPTIRDGQPITEGDAKERPAAPATEPDVKTIAEGIEEYSVKGRRLGMKITPNQGPSYYIFDPTGDGSMQESSLDDLDGYRNITKWRIGKW